jgi:hypothetical protein
MANTPGIAARFAGFIVVPFFAHKNRSKTARSIFYSALRTVDSFNRQNQRLPEAYFARV